MGIFQGEVISRHWREQSTVCLGFTGFEGICPAKNGYKNGYLYFEFDMPERHARIIRNIHEIGREQVTKLMRPNDDLLVGFNRHPRPTNRHEVEGWDEVEGVYIFVYEKAHRMWEYTFPLYIGEAECFADRFCGHKRWNEAERNGMNYIFTMEALGGEEQRQEREEELIEYDQPPLNQQHTRN